MFASSGDATVQYTSLLALALVVPLLTVTLIGIAFCLRRKRWKVVLLYLFLTPVVFVTILLLDVPRILGLIYLALMALVLIVRGKATRVRYPFEE
jgi:hypothetical protein